MRRPFRAAICCLFFLAAFGRAQSISGGPGTLSQLQKLVTSGGATTVAFSSIPANYSSLVVYYQARTTAAVSIAGLRMQINSDSTATDYTLTQQLVAGSTTVSGANAGNSSAGSFVNNIPGTSVGSGFASLGQIVIPNYSATTFYKRFMHTGGYSQVGNQDLVLQSIGTWASTAAITSLTFSLDSSDVFVDGSTFVLYGAQ